MCCLCTECVNERMICGPCLSAYFISETPRAIKFGIGGVKHCYQPFCFGSCRSIELHIYLETQTELFTHSKLCRSGVLLPYLLQTSSRCVEYRTKYKEIYFWPCALWYWAMWLSWKHFLSDQINTNISAKQNILRKMCIPVYFVGLLTLVFFFRVFFDEMRSIFRNSDKLQASPTQEVNPITLKRIQGTEVRLVDCEIYRRLYSWYSNFRHLT